MNYEIRKAILRKLYRLDYCGGRHTSIDNLTKGFPGHLKKEVKKESYLLIKEALLLSKPKPDSLHVFLNPRRAKDIYSIIFDNNKLEL